MRKFIYECWTGIMDHKLNPLRHIPDLQVRHMVMQVLAFMWSAIFALQTTNIFMNFGIRSIAHVAFVTGVVITVATFKVAETTGFKFRSGYHSHGRGRNYVIHRDKKGKITKQYLPDNDPGGEHE